MSEPSSAPDLSVVVPSVNGLRYLERCLDALGRQEGRVGLEVLVVDRCGPELRRRVEDRFPEVRIVPAPPATSIPELRAAGVRASTAPSVALIEDHVIVPPEWARRMLEARARGAAVVGGGVANLATERLVDRAAFLCEYGHMLDPPAAGPAEWLTGNNTVYDRVLLERHISVMEEGGWEDRLHAALRHDGVTLVWRPDIVVGHEMHFTVGEYLVQRYHYSRAYSGRRARDLGTLRRLVYAGAAPLLPAVLLWRISRSAWKRPEHRRDLVRSLPILSIWTVAWAAGDAVGFLRGPGKSLDEVR